MVKRIFKVWMVIVIVLVSAAISINVYNNRPTFILERVRKQIESTHPEKFETYADWLWSDGRSFIFDVYVMNLFSPASAKMHVVGKEEFDNEKAFVLEAFLEPSHAFKKLYDAKMVIASAVTENAKDSLWYRELTVTPEKEKSKEIIFNPSENIAIREDVKYKIPERTHDPLSVFFAFLGGEITLGKEIVLNVFSKEEIYEFRATPTKLNKGIYEFSGEVSRQDKSSTHGAHFTMWVLSGKVRVPLLIKASSGVGIAYLRLRSVE